MFRPICVESGVRTFNRDIWHLNMDNRQEPAIADPSDDPGTSGSSKPLNSAAGAVSTRDRDKARHIMTHRFKRHELNCVSEPDRFDFRHSCADVPEGSFNVLHYGAGVEIDPGAFESFYMLEMPLSGGTDIAIGSSSFRSRPDRATVLSPGRKFTSFWHPGTTQIMLKIDKTSLIRRWRSGLEDDDDTWPMFHPSLDLSTPSGWRVRSLMLQLLNEFRHSTNRPDWGFEKTTLSGAIIDALFADFARNGLGRIESEHLQVHPRHVRRCVQFIRGNLQSDLSISVLARVAGTSERTLFDGFRQFVGQAPMQFVLEQRLKAARSRLRQGASSVAEVATCCGFNHMGRFSKYYHEAFGERPSATLKKS